LTDQATAMWRSWAEALFGFFLVIALAVSSWALSTVVRLDVRLTAIENNRFTNADGLKIWQEVLQIREIIARLPSEVPPKWLLSRFERMETQTEQNGKLIEAVHARQQRILQQLDRR